MTTRDYEGPIESHEVHSLRLIGQAQEELEDGDRLQASEKAWGAVAHILKAIAKRRGWRYEAHAHAYRVARRLTTHAGNPRIYYLFEIANELHRNFYTDSQPLNSLQVNIECVNELMGMLMHVD